ncbi:hypothetical protein Tco_0785880 [Tanacetum coccineum]
MDRGFRRIVLSGGNLDLCALFQGDLNGVVGTVVLVRNRMEPVFEICKCAEDRQSKVCDGHDLRHLNPVAHVKAIDDHLLSYQPDTGHFPREWNTSFLGATEKNRRCEGICHRCHLNRNQRKHHLFKSLRPWRLGIATWPVNWFRASSVRIYQICNLGAILTSSMDRVFKSAQRCSRFGLHGRRIVRVGLRVQGTANDGVSGRELTLVFENPRHVSPWPTCGGGVTVGRQPEEGEKENGEWRRVT